jgi:protein tyrosine/serine phosphatase
MNRVLIAAAWMVALAGCYRNLGSPSDSEATIVPTKPLASPRDDIPGLPNFARVSPGLFRAGQPDEGGFAEAKKRGVKTVVNLRTLHSDRDELKGLGLAYVKIHFNPLHPEDEDVIAFLKVVADPANQPVLVHCQHGADRTGTMVAIYRVMIEGWPMEEAMLELPRFGFHRIWGNMKRYLHNLDVREIREALATAEAPAPERIE